MDRQLALARLSEDAGEVDQDNPEDSYVSVHSSAARNHHSISIGRFVSGLMMAIRDPIVLVFALANLAQVFGLTFVLFFPTCACNLPRSLS
jgi:hypothetical protein